MPEGKKVRVLIKTMQNVYVGDLLIPPMRHRIVDVVNEEQRQFINLTDVVINDTDKESFVSLNKTLISSITELPPTKATDKVTELPPAKAS